RRRPWLLKVASRLIRVLPVALVLVLVPQIRHAFSHGARHHSGVRPATESEFGPIAAAATAVWRYESDPRPYRSFNVSPKKLRVSVVSVRIAQRDPRFALAAVQPIGVTGHAAPGRALVLLSRVGRSGMRSPWHSLWDGTLIPRACSSATPAAIRDLVCPN